MMGSLEAVRISFEDELHISSEDGPVNFQNLFRDLDDGIQELEDIITAGATSRHLVNPSDSEIELLLAQEAMLDAEMIIYAIISPRGYPEDEAMITAVMQAEEKQIVERQQETLLCKENDRQVLESAIKRAEFQLDTLKVWRNKAERSVKERRNESKDIKHKLKGVVPLMFKKYVERGEEITHELTTFLEKYFPKPSKEDIQKYNKKNPSKPARPSSTTNFYTVARIIDMLREASPDDYFNLGPRFWPPYMEALHRVGLITYHPSDATLFKLATLAD